MGDHELPYQVDNAGVTRIEFGTDLIGFERLIYLKKAIKYRLQQVILCAARLT